MRRLMFAEFTSVTLATFLAALSFQRVFAGSSYLAPLIGAVLIPTAITVVGMYRNATAASTLLWSFLGFVIYTTYAALGDTAPNVVPTLTTFRELASGLTGGWAELLTISLPAPTEPRLLVVALALTWSAAAVGAEFAHRSRSTVAPVIPALCVYLATLGFGASQQRSSLALPLAVAAAVLFTLLVHANRWSVIEPAGLRTKTDPDEDDDDLLERSRRLSVDTSANRWILLGLPVIAVATLVAGLVGPRIPQRDGRFDPRSLRDQRIELTNASSPLDRLKGELTLVADNPPLRFSVRTESVAQTQAIGRIRLAVLDRFDGANWSSSEVYTRAGVALPAGPDRSVSTVEVRQDITIVNLDGGPWLPAADRPETITGSGSGAELEVAVDPTTGVLISTADDLDELSYRVVSVVPRPNADELAALPVADRSSDTSALTDVPNMPAELRQLAQRLSEGESGTTGAGTDDQAEAPYTRLVRLQDALAQSYGYSEEVPSGSSYGRLTRFLTDERVGYAEQFAATFATMARSLGFPTRLVFGYLVSEIDPATGLLVTRTDITSRQAHVWPEVLLGEGDGEWIAFEPTPPRIAGPAPPVSDTVRDTLSAGGLVTTEGSDGRSTRATGGVFSEQAERPFYLAAPFLATVTVLVTLAMLLAILVLSKRLRRRRRRNSASTTNQVLGAWAQVTDRLLEVGVNVDRSMTAKEVVAASSPLVSDRATDRLAVMVPFVTVALYSPVPPSAEGAAEMWEHADAFHREVLDGKQWYRGTVALLNPRPLLLGVTRR